MLLVNVLAKNTTVRHNSRFTFHQLPFPRLDLKVEAVGPHVHTHVETVASVEVK